LKSAYQYHAVKFSVFIIRLVATMASISVKPHSALVAPKPGHHHPQNVPQYSASK